MTAFPTLPPARFQTIFEQAPFGIVVFTPEGDFLGGNDAWERIWETTREEVMGFNVLRDLSMMPAEVREAIQGAFRGEMREVPTAYYDPASLGRKARPRYIEGYIFPIRDDQQRICQVVMHVTDATERVRLKKELQASQSFLSAIGKLVPATIGVYELATGKYLYLSDAFEKMLGYPVQRVLQEGVPFVWSLIHPDDVKRVSDQQENALRKIAAQEPEMRVDPVVTFEYRMKAADGSWKHLHTVGTVFERDAHGAAKTVINASLDVTELKEAIRFRDEFLAIASHELKTPLTPLRLQLGLLNSLMDHGGLDSIPIDRLRKIAQISEAQIDRLTGLVNNLLDASRISLGKLALEMSTRDLGAFVREVAEGYRVPASVRGAHLEIDAQAGIGLKFDSIRIAQVVSNLLNNAIVHSGASRIEVRVMVLPGDRHACIEVRDNGVGIKQEDLGRVFERFEGSAPGGAKLGGLGLGLYISRQIAHAHGGEISVESKTGAGTAFALVLPRK